MTHPPSTRRARRAGSVKTLLALLLAVVLLVACGAPRQGPEEGPSGSIAFVSDRDGNDELYLLSLATGVEVRLTENAGFDRAPAWHPDGRVLAFNSRRAPHEDRPQIYLLDPATGEVTRLGDSAAEQHRAAFDPAGEAVYFQQGVFFVEPFNILRLELADGGTVPITTSSDAAVWNAAASPSPDGRWLAYQSNAHLDEPTGPFPQILHVLDLETGDVSVVRFAGSPLEDASIDGPTWSPDGTRLAFSSGGRLWLVEVDGSEPADWQATALTEGPDDSSPAFSPDGRWLAYQVDVEGEGDDEHDLTLLRLLDLQTLEWQALTEGRTPAWTAESW